MPILRIRRPITKCCNFFCNSFQFMKFKANQLTPMQFHGASGVLQNLPQSSGCQSSPKPTQLIWIASGLWIYKGLQVNWKHCIKIAWIADQTQKTALLASDPSHFWVNSQLAHDPGMPGTINLNCIRIASMERIAGWLKALHKNCVDCRPIPEFNWNPQPFRRMFCRYCGLYHFFAILTQCIWILSQFPNLTQSSTILRIAKGLSDSWAFPWILGQSSNRCAIHSGS